VINMTNEREKKDSHLKGKSGNYDFHDVFNVLSSKWTKVNNLFIHLLNKFYSREKKESSIEGGCAFCWRGSL
jgi:hypothetical protein